MLVLFMYGHESDFVSPELNSNVPIIYDPYQSSKNIMIGPWRGELCVTGKELWNENIDKSVNASYCNSYYSPYTFQLTFRDELRTRSRNFFRGLFGRRN